MDFDIETNVVDVDVDVDASYRIEMECWLWCCVHEPDYVVVYGRSNRGPHDEDDDNDGATTNGHDKYHGRRE